MKLDLKTTSQEEEILKSYLEENASEILADKINHGVFIEQDGKRLLNKKSLALFIEYATKEAQKISAKGARSAFVNNETVYGWAIHYFEEDSIIGTLYNEDGSEYKKHVPQPKTSGKSTYTPTSVKKPEPQLSLFDMINTDNNNENTNTESEITYNEKPEENDDAPTDEDLDKAFDNVITPREEQAAEKPIEQKGTPFYEKYKEMALKYQDCIVCYKIGDFYEILGKKAVTVANELDLTLTGRDCGISERVPMVGFPYHAADLYFSKLVGKGYKVAVVEQNSLKIKPDQKNEESIINNETGEILSESTDDIMKNYYKGALLTLLELFGEEATIG